MRFAQILFSLIATASAIDIRLNTNRGCDGAVGMVCTKRAADVCCGQERVDAQSASIYFIPVDWHLNCRGHNNGWCRGLKQSMDARNTNFICLQDGPFSGGGYGFIAKKRSAETGSTSGKCQKPDTLEIEGGTKFNITDMEDSTIDEL